NIRYQTQLISFARDPQRKCGALLLLQRFFDAITQELEPSLGMFARPAKTLTERAPVEKHRRQTRLLAVVIAKARLAIGVGQRMGLPNVQMITQEHDIPAVLERPARSVERHIGGGAGQTVRPAE